MKGTSDRTKEPMRPDYRAGRRERLKDRFLREERPGLNDSEILELLLQYAVPGRDLGPAAEDLLQRFGSLGGVLNASTVELIETEGIGKHAAVLIRLAADLAARSADAASAAPEILADPKQIERYLISQFAGMKEERLLLIFLDGQGLILGEEFIGTGTVREAVAYPRQVMETALTYNASALILAHNHPHGPPIPSLRDREEGERLRQILRPFDIKVLDSIVVGGNRCFSIFRNRPL
jgi:DNA repair protein RadC